MVVAVASTAMSDSYQPYDTGAMPDPQLVSVEELLTIHTVQLEALVRLGLGKNLWTRAEALAVIDGVAEEFAERRRRRPERN